MQTTEITESNPDVDAESLEWIVAEDEQVEQVSDLDMQWIGTPLFRGGSRTFLVALVFLAVALALATESIAGSQQDRRSSGSNPTRSRWREPVSKSHCGG